VLLLLCRYKGHLLDTMPKYPINIFLPAAGLGERLRPITNGLPKPLLPVLGKPIIESILENLTSVCTGDIGINIHYKPEMIRAWAKRSVWANNITLFPENPILGTGGALKNAEPFLSRGPFIVHNSDILININWSRLIDEHISSGNIATLVCHRLSQISNVVIDKNNQVLDVENAGASKPDPLTKADKVAYTGVAIYSPEFLKFLPMGVSHTTVAWIAASKAGRNVRAMDFTGCHWNDIGTPETYARAVLDILQGDGETVYVSPSACIGRVDIDGYAVIESRSRVNDGAVIKNCIVMPDAIVSGKHENRIIGLDYSVALSESDMQPSLYAADKKRVDLSEQLFAHYFGHQIQGEDVAKSPLHSALWSDAIMIGRGGSDRRYFRVRHNGKTAILMECIPDDPDYERHILYTHFFSSHDLPVPKLLAMDRLHKLALFEDLGDTSLYTFMKLSHTDKTIKETYRNVLTILINLHTHITDHVHECQMLQNRIFDYDYFRWETNYFLERFVVGLNKTLVANKQVVDEEFQRLARTADAHPKSAIHRDFQCQNIMITSNRVPRIIDIQGARMAPPAYDVASLLWDPYHRLADRIRENLLGYYVSGMKNSLKNFNENLFFESLTTCRLQRHMQALGAYGFLAVVKGKKYFTKHIPEGLRLLKEDLTAVKYEYPALAELVDRL